LLRDYPTISQIRQACEALNEPIAREAERAIYRRLAEKRREQFPSRLPRTLEEQQRIDEKIGAWRRSLGIPKNWPAPAWQPSAGTPLYSAGTHARRRL
jgi:hypothetical protein